MENTVKNQYVFIQLGPEPMAFDKLFARSESIILLDVLDSKTALVELNGIEPEDVYNEFSNILLEPNLSDYVLSTKKSKSPFTEEDYEYMRADTEKMLTERFKLPPEFAKQRAQLEIDSLKDTFSKMPEFL